MTSKRKYKKTTRYIIHWDNSAGSGIFDGATLEVEAFDIKDAQQKAENMASMFGKKVLYIRKK